MKIPFGRTVRNICEGDMCVFGKLSTRSSEQLTSSKQQLPLDSPQSQPSDDVALGKKCDQDGDRHGNHGSHTEEPELNAS